MERFYIVENKEYLKSVERDNEIQKSRNEFIKDFFDRYGIEGNSYFLRGNGGMNTPLPESYKKSISLCIEDTEKNRKKYGSQFKKSKMEGMCDFRKNSSLLKILQEECVSKQVIVNVWETRSGYYFKELEYGGYSIQRFVLDNKMYLKVSTDSFSNWNITPKYDGFTEIKASEFFLALEQYEASKGER